MLTRDSRIEEAPKGPEFYQGWVTSHDDAAALLRYCALGATVIFDPLRPRKRERAAIVGATREFTLVLDAAPEHAVNARDLYTLPFRAHPMVKRVRSLLDSARAAVRPLVIGSEKPPAPTGALA